MKTGYIVTMILVGLIAGVFHFFVSPLTSGEAGLAVSGLALVIARSAGDPRAKRVKVTIEPSVDEGHALTHPKDKLTPNLAKHYESLPDPVRSHRVRFRIKNVSDFTLERPVLTFRLPLQKQHPDEQGQRLTFRSNLFNYQRDIQLLEFEGTRILSNSISPYWNHDDNITVWIRMVLDAGGLDPFTVDVSVNSENADGVTKKVEIDPARRLSQ